MSFHSVKNSARVASRPRCEKTYLVALEYLMRPRGPVWGDFKRLAIENDLSPNQLCAAVVRIKNRVRGEG